MVIYNLIKFGDRNNHCYEILTQREGENETIFTGIGVRIKRIPFNSTVDYYKTLVGFFKNNHYDVIHVHTHKDLPIVLQAAKEVEIKCRVAHSHNARVDIPKFLWPMFHYMHHPYEKYATHLFGCSELALKWLFPVNWQKGIIIPNGIDLEKFRFDVCTRRKFRDAIGINDDTKLFINVGRCTLQKNQKFILDLARGRQNKDELYIIIGDGPLYNELERYRELNKIDNVRLLGTRSDVANWLSAADIFLLPSLYEGLGIVAIEAQSSGLIVLATDTLPPEADMQLGNFYRLSLKEKKKWNKLLNLKPNNNYERTRIFQRALNSPYNITTVTQTVEGLYTGKLYDTIPSH